MTITKRKRLRIKKAFTLFILFTLVNQTLTPSIAYALTAGPTAPEATSFEPIDTTDMVNPLSGSFTYNMPLLEVPGSEGGYPLSLSYHAGIQPNEEASWVGLGWTLNPGSIARNVNGYPDDWSGAQGLTRSVWNGGSTETITGGVAIGYTAASFSVGLAFSQDTYQGFGVGVNVGASLGLGGSNIFGIGVNVGVTPYGQAYAGAGLTYNAAIPGMKGLASSTTIGLSTNFKSVNANLSEGISEKDGKNTTSLLGASIGTSNIKPSFSVGGGEITSVSNAKGDKVSTHSSGLSISIPLGFFSISLGYNYTRYWSDNPNPFVANGVLNNRNTVTGPDDLTNSDDDNYELFDPVNTNIVDNPDPIEQLGGTYPNFDNYRVTAQGLGGNIRPYIFSSILYNENRITNSDHTSDSYGVNLSPTVRPNTVWQFRFINDVSNSYQQGHPWSTDQSYNFDGNPQYGYHDGATSDGLYGYDATTNRLEGSSHIEYFTNDAIHDGTAALRGFIDCDAAGFTRGTTTTPGLINQLTNPTIGKQIGGFMITNASGVTYHYALPAYSSDEFQRSENEVAANITNTSHNISWKYTDLTKNEAYAYTWYLTAITGPDYISRGGTPGKLDASDWGYWVKFDYGKWTDTYRWRNPSEGENEDPASPGNTIYSMGRKELYYLDAVETRTHTAIFEKEIRADGKGMAYHNEDNTNPYQPTALYYPYNNGSIYEHPKATLRLNNIYLFQNDQLPININAIRQNSTAYNQSFTYSGGVENVHYGQNVIDINDITPALKSSCLRKIAFNYDYSLTPGCPNSYDPGGLTTYVQTPSTTAPTALLGKLTLLSVDFQGKGGTAVTPPTQFQYDLDPADPANQENISITKLQSFNIQTSQIDPAVIQVQTYYKVKKGAILKFAINGVDYYCSVLGLTNGTNAFKVVFLNNAPTALISNIPAVFTKNPAYNKDAFDNWGYYKCDFGTGPLLYQFKYLNTGSGGITSPGSSLPVIKLRNTSAVSNESTDVWSLRRINSSIGTAINIDYEGNTYNKSVLSKGKPIVIDGVAGTPGLPHNFTYTVNPMGIDLSTAYKIGDVVHIVFIANHVFAPKTFAFGNSDSYPTPATITGINADQNQLTIQLDPQMESVVGTSTDFTVSLLYANLSVNSPVFTGGGIRVKDIIVDDLNGNKNKTAYNYEMPGNPPGQPSSSGVTSYEPLIFNITGLSDFYYDLIINQNTNDPTNAIKAYRKALYGNNSNVLSISREAPGPGVMYEYVTVANSSILPNGNAIPVEGKTMYQYEVFKPEMIGIDDYNDEEPIAANQAGPNINLSLPVHTQITGQAKKDRTIKDYTSRIGSLKRMITYDNLGNKLTEKVNHFLNDDLDNTSFQNQVAFYEPRLASSTSAPYNGVSYNNIGVIKERYGNARLLVRSVQVAPPNVTYNVQSALMMSNKETFPAFQTGTTQIDYKNGTRTDQSNLAYDFYTGAVTKTLTIDSYGNRFISKTTPAYTVSNGSTLVYPALGLKTHDDDPGAIQHKQMLTQEASNYTFSVDLNNVNLGVVTASAQTWSSSIPVLDPNGNTVTGTTESNVWRMEKSLSWLAAGSTANNVTPFASFVDYFGTGGSTNASWKNTGQVTKYNVYSSALEATDINKQYAATRMGYSNSKVLITGSPAMYNEIAYTGAEDALLSNGNFSNNISKGGGTIVTDTVNSHTGVNTLMVPANTNGFTYTVPITSLSAIPQNYSVAVWVKPTAANVNLAQLYYQVGAAAAVTSTQTYAKNAAGWYLLEMMVPASAITSGNLVVGCKNASASALYFDDFRFQPTAAAAIAYVYDKKTGELTHVIGDNNLFIRYQYDAIGRLVRVYKEVIGKQFAPIVEGIAYNFGKMPTACPIVPVSTPPTTASVSLGSFVTSDPIDNEWKQEAPTGYTVAADDGTTINPGKNAGLNAGRFAYFSTAGSTATPITFIGGNLTFTAKGSGTIEVQLLASYDNAVQARKTFALTSSFQTFSWTLSGLYPQTEMIAAIIVNGGNSSEQASVQFQKNFDLNLSQLTGLGSTYTRFRADQTSLIGNSEKGWYGWHDRTNTPRKKYLQHSAYARMRFQTSATQIAIEYVRDFYDKRVVNLFAVNQSQSGKVWDSNGNVIAGTGGVNNYTQVTAGQTYTISGLLTTSPTIVWYHSGTPLGAPVALTNVAAPLQPPLYQVVAPATATNLGLLVQNSNDNFLVYSNCMIQQGAIGTVTPLDGTIPSAFTPFSGYTPSHISGPAIFINGVLYKYYQVEGNDVAKVIQFVTDALPAGNKTVEVMMPGQGTYLPEDPHVRRSGTFLRAVYFPGTTGTTVAPSTTAAPGSIVYIHDSILSGYNISSDAQNNAWMMMTERNASYGFIGDIFSEGYAGRLLATDISTPALTTAFAAKLASFGVDKYWFQIGVNDFGFNTPLPLFYAQYKSLVEQLKGLRPNAKIYIQSTGPESYEGANGELVADDGFTSNGPAANDFRDVQRAIATSHSYCEYVNFEGLFSPVIANLSDGIHPTDAGNVLYANGVKNKSTLLGTVQPVTALAFYRSTTRDMVQSIPGIYTITATGGKAPYTFTKLSGSLSPGLTFNADGTITGTPAIGGSYPLSVKVTDANGSSVTQAFTLTVDLLPSIVVGPQHIMNAQVNIPYTKAFKGYYGYGPYSFFITPGALPAGMSFNGATGVLSGTPTSTGTSNFAIEATDHYGFTGFTDYALVTGTTPPVALTDFYTVTASVDANNHLWLTGHLNDIYSETLFTYIGAYYTPAGGSEIFLSGGLVNLAPGMKNSAPVDMGAMGLLPGTFSVRMFNGGINPSALDNVSIGYNATTTQSLTTNASSPTEQFAVTATINTLGHLIVTASLPHAPSTSIYSAVGAGVTQNGTSTYMPGPPSGIIINAGSLSSTADFGLVPASTGSVAVQIFIGGVSPSADTGYVITFNATTSLTLTMPPPH
ncbi:MAG: hypothetical protein JWR09_3159 [Mucilaginibacter sp.]|nr:hypothetical protein [Mucilaginibacter sp.]